jgi:hypothetical protein
MGNLEKLKAERERGFRKGEGRKAQGILGKAKGMGQRAKRIQRLVLGSKIHPQGNTPHGNEIKKGFSPVEHPALNRLNGARGVNFAVTIVPQLNGP